MARLLLVLIGVAFALFGAIVLNGAVARDTLTCEPDRCVADRYRWVAYGGPSGRREFAPRSVRSLTVATRTAGPGGHEWVFEIAGEDDLAIRLRIDDAQAYDLRRWFDSPAGSISFEGPRRTRDYPFAAILGAVALGAFLVAITRGGDSRDDDDEDEAT